MRLGVCVVVTSTAGNTFRIAPMIASMFAFSWTALKTSPFAFGWLAAIRYACIASAADRYGRFSVHAVSYTVSGRPWAARYVKRLMIVSNRIPIVQP